MESYYLSAGDDRSRPGTVVCVGPHDVTGVECDISCVLIIRVDFVHEELKRKSLKRKSLKGDVWGPVKRT